MPEQFDAYYKWLGIPPKDQPPNHYRLLGIELFESHAEVIEASAERQATYLHEVSAGPNVKESQKLLNEIAAARLCLLDPEKKATYDTELKSKITVNVTVDALSGENSPLNDLPWDDLEPLMTNGSSSDTTPKAEAASETLRLPAADSSGVFSAPKSLTATKPQPQATAGAKSSKSKILWLAVGGGAIVIVGAVVAAILLSSGGPDNELVFQEPPSGETPKDTTPPRTEKKDGQSDKKDGKVKRNGDNNQNGKKDDNKKDDGKVKPPENVGNGVVPFVLLPVLSSVPFGVTGSLLDPKNGTGIKNGNGETGVEQLPIRTNEFQTLWPLEVTSLSGGTEFAFIEESNCVFARGNDEDDIYTIEAKTDISDITAIRIEALPHNVLPERGPGLGEDGGFSIYELRVIAVPARNPAAANEVSESASQRGRPSWPRNPSAKYEVLVSGVKSEEVPGRIDKLVDGVNLPYWGVRRPGESTTLTMFLKTPIRHVGGTQLYVQLAQREKLGHFRVSVSNDPELAGEKTRIEATLPLFVNLGGNTNKDKLGRTWQASQEFDRGEFGHVGGRPEGTDLNETLTSCISGLTEFCVTLPDGKYNVLLVFGARCPRDAAQRSFHVSASGIEKQTIKDIKKNQSFVERILPGVEAKDGGLTIQFASEKGEPFLNGIGIVKAK